MYNQRVFAITSPHCDTLNGTRLCVDLMYVAMGHDPVLRRGVTLLWFGGRGSGGNSVVHADGK